MTSHIATLNKVKKVTEEVREHFLKYGSLYDLDGRKAYVRGVISSFQKYDAPELSTETLYLLFELALGIDCRE